jgi:mannose-1-phosphate guanylyltransferase/phosphomannomutase
VRWRGDGLWLELESGKVLNDDELTVLAAQRFFQSGGRELAVPVHAPSVLEALAAADGGRVVRLPAGRLGTAGRDYHIQVGPGRVPQSVFWSDSLLRMAYVLAGLPSEEALAAIPPLYRVTCSVDCPWELTGQVMRNLVTSAAGTVEMIEGVRTRHARGWTLARPDGLTPSYRIWADGESMEIARELAATLAERVQSLVAAQEPATPESSGTCV